MSTIEQRLQREEREAARPVSGPPRVGVGDELRALQREYKDRLDEARSIRDKARDENRKLTSDEVNKIDAALSRAEQLRGQIDSMYDEGKPFLPLYDPGAGPEDFYSPRPRSMAIDGRLSFRSLFPDLDGRMSGFRHFGDYWQALISGRHDPRLFEQRVHTAGVKPAGGYAVPTQYVADLFDAVLQNSIILSRARVIPLTALRVEEPAWDDLDQSDGSYYGGFKPEWLGEDEEHSGEQTATLRQLVLEANKLALYTSLSRELAFASSANLEEQLKTALRRSITLGLDEAFILGDGDGKPKGIATSANPALITVNRVTADKVSYADFAGMLGRLHGSALNGAIWIMNPSVLPELLQMTSGNDGQLVWQPNARDGKPTSLFGLPIHWFDRMPDLGTKGDVLLVNPRFYTAALAPDVWLDASQSVHWKRDRIALRAVTLADGVGSWDKPYTPPAGPSRSWAVALDMPSG